VLVLPIVLVAGVLVYLRTDAGLESLRRLAVDLGSTPEMRISLDRLEGAFPENLRLVGLSLSDEQGTWLSVDQAHLRWDPAALLRGRLHVEVVEAGHVDLERLPAGDTAPTEGPTEITLPSLPIAVTVDRLAVDEIALGEPVVGQPARLTLQAALKGEENGPVTAEIHARRLDGVAASLDGTARVQPTDQHLSVDLSLHEPAGGLIATMANLPGAPAVTVTLKGDGPLVGWQGTLAMQAEDTAAVRADLTLVSLQPPALRLDATGDVQALVPPEIRPLLGDALAVSGRFAQDDEGRLAARDVAVKAAVGTLAAEGSFDPDGQAFTATLIASIENGRLLQPLAGGRSISTGTLHIEARGTTARAGADVSLAVQGIDLVDPALQQAAGDSLSLTGEATYDVADQSLDVLQAQIETGEATVKVDGQMAFTGEHPAGHVTLSVAQADLGRFSGLAGTELGGRLGLQADVTMTADGAAVADATVNVDQPAGGPPGTADLLGDHAQIVAKARRAPDGVVTVENLQADAAAFALAASGRVDPAAQTLQGMKADLTLPELSRFSQLAGMPLAGRVHLTAALDGPFAAPQGTVDVEGQDLLVGQETIPKITLTYAGGQDGGHLIADGRSGYGPVRLSADVAHRADGSIAITGADVRYADALQLRGDVTVQPAGPLAEGHIPGTVSDLAPLGRLAQLDLAGRGKLDIQLSTPDGRQSVVASVDAQNLRQGEGEQALRLASLALQARVADALGTPRLQAEVKGTGLDAGTVELASLSASATGTPAALDVTAEGRGRFDEPLQFSTAARLGLGAATEVRLNKLQARWGQDELRLLQPATATLQGSAMRLTPLQIAVGGGRLTAQGSKTATAVDLQARLEDLPVSIAKRFDDSLESAKGSIDATLTVKGAPRQPDVRFTVDGSGIAVLQSNPLTKPPAFGLSLKGGIDNGTLSVDGRITDLTPKPFVLSARVPARLSLDPFAFELPPQGALRAGLDWSGDLAPLMALAPVDQVNFGGQGKIDLNVSGTVASPQIGGTISISQAGLEYGQTGTLLRPLNLVISGDASRLVIRTLEAKDGGDGTISGKGYVELAGGKPGAMDLSLAFRNAVLIRRDDVTAKLTGDIAAKGVIGERLDLTGSIRSDIVEVRLVNRLPPSVPQIDVTYVEPKKDTAEEAQEFEPLAPDTPWLFLDLKVDLPNRVYVRGQGLESEWAGAFTITGTAQSPHVEGSLRPVRGNFSLLGRTFVLDRGTISFNGGSLNPQLDLGATYTGTTITAKVRVTGSASDPKIELSSEPPLPQDEILARVLFQKSSANLTAGEALALANAATALTNNRTEGIVDVMRNTLGLDTLTFGGSNDPQDNIGTVEVGRRINRDVYVGVQQGATAESSAVSVEVDLFRGLQAKSTVGATGDSSVGLQWQMDY